MKSSTEGRRRSAPSAPSAARGWSRRHSRRSLPACGGRGRSRRHCGSWRGSASASSSASSTCSAAMRSTSGSASSKLSTRMTAPKSRQLARGGLGARQQLRAGARPPPRRRRRRPASSVMRIDCAAASCSACARRSAAIQAGSLPRVGDDQHLGRAGDHVDADRAEDLALGGRDIGVAGADDLGDRRGSSRCHRRARRSPARRRRGRSR